jgi:hypothetical protein
VTRRVVLFLDDQNVYKGAREMSHQHWEPSQYGQIDPVKLGQLLVQRSPGRDGRTLAGVRVYRGQPDSSKEPRAYGANLLKPALEAVAQINQNRSPRCEVAAWSAPGMHSRRLSITGTKVWCHWLGPDDYKLVADLTNCAVGA